MKNKSQNKNEVLLKELKKASQRIEEVRGRFKESHAQLKSLLEQMHEKT
jgi:hypothetical protein